jgi:hypothetical protein
LKYDWEPYQADGTLAVHLLAPPHRGPKWYVNREAVCGFKAREWFHPRAEARLCQTCKQLGLAQREQDNGG